MECVPSTGVVPSKKSHRLSTVDVADRVLVIDAGRVVEDGTPAELRASGGHYAGLHTAWRESLV